MQQGIVYDYFLEASLTMNDFMILVYQVGLIDVNHVRNNDSSKMVSLAIIAFRDLINILSNQLLQI